MLIKGARVTTSYASADRLNLWVRNARISFEPLPEKQDVVLDLDGYLVLPGLINAHDHLELNLFPKLGRGPYPNASLWARDVYRPHAAPIKQHLSVPKSLRLRWGGIKNLISGVTTVAHHNPFDPLFLEPDFPVRVVKRYGWAHSLEFSPDWRERLQKTPAGYPFVIHAAEGTDEHARSEIQTLANAGAFNRSTILVHGVGIDPSHLLEIQRGGAGIVWCPSSNHFTLRRTLDPVILNSGIPISLGSDSALTADGDLFDEMLAAHRIVDADRVFDMVTSEPARMFRLPAGFGQISHGGPADLLVIKDKGQSPAIALLQNYPELVVVRGRVHLVSSELARRCPPEILKSLHSLDVEGRPSYKIAQPVSSLLNETRGFLQETPRLAGKAIAA